MSEVLNYYKISHYEPYDGSDDIIMGHKSRFTDSELSVMVYDVIDDYVLELPPLIEVVVVQ